MAQLTLDSEGSDSLAKQRNHSGWFQNHAAALKLHGYLPSESRKAFQMKQLLECKQLQYLAKSNSQNYQKPARYGMCFAIVMVCPGHSWSHNWAGTIGICVTLIHSFTTSVSSLTVTEMDYTWLDRQNLQKLVDKLLKTKLSTHKSQTGWMFPVV